MFHRAFRNIAPVDTEFDCCLLTGGSKVITIRDYVDGDANSLWEIFYNTIRNVNIRDYSQVEVEAWASDAQDPKL